MTDKDMILLFDLLKEFRRLYGDNQDKVETILDAEAIVGDELLDRDVKGVV